MNDPTVTHDERQRRRSEIRGLHRPSIYTDSQKSTTSQLHPSNPHVTSNDAVEGPDGDVRFALSPSSYSIHDPDGFRTRYPPLSHPPPLQHTLNIQPHIGTDDALDPTHPTTDLPGHESLSCETKGEVSSGYNIGNRDGGENQHMPTQYGSQSQQIQVKTSVNNSRGDKQPTSHINRPEDNRNHDEDEEEEGGYFDYDSDSDYNIHSSACSISSGARKVVTPVSAEDLAKVVSELRAFQSQQAHLISLGHEVDSESIETLSHGQSSGMHSGIAGDSATFALARPAQETKSGHNYDPASYSADETLQIGRLAPQLHTITRHKKRLAEQEAVLNKLLDTSFLSPIAHTTHTPTTQTAINTHPNQPVTISPVNGEVVTNPPQSNSIDNNPPTELPPLQRPDVDEEVVKAEVVIEDVINDIISNSNNNNSNTPSRSHSIANSIRGNDTDDDADSMHHILLQHKNSTRNIFTHIYDTFNCIPFIR